MIDKKILKNLRVSVDQVKQWTRYGVFSGAVFSSIKLSTRGYTLRLRDGSDCVDFKWSDRQYLKILCERTTFAHALECMQREKVVFENFHHKVRFKDEVMVIGLAEHEWRVPSHAELVSFINKDGWWVVNPHLNWETGGY
jgi:hypothetical protein